MNHLETVRSILQVAASSATAAAILNHVATRKNLRKAETVRRLIQVCGSGTKRTAIIAVLRQLEANGFGKFIEGRKGYESRFEWAVV